MGILAQQVLNGFVLGSIYCLVALGLSLIYGIMEVPNFAHGHLYMIGAYVVLFLLLAGVNYWVTLVLAMALMALVGLVVERVVFRPMRDAPQTSVLIAAVGLLLFLEALAQALWGADYRRMPPVFESTVRILGLQITGQRLVVVVAAVVLMLLLYLFLKRTRLGAAIEAVAQDRDGAALVGIPVGTVTMVTFAVATALAAAAAALAGPIFLVYPGMGAMVALKAFVIIVLGGMGSLPGAVLGGYILGLAESLSVTFLPAEFKDVVAFLLLVAILSLRPAGLFSREAG
ncbi:branched-chain amino acid ABC transporter permease [Caldinitratiruptor microaerophilus]|uniref:Branched-chain amino acid ABC transporter permease n=1 Tax=Caldinitratiruptor microaerophilus TaxID=671077 RepID=A0AA35G6S1_9FIRM|nr:branched-chain amino acid ABC transporter permease [Caldinitratiruptor microaerophilus]BDG58985.1 branched-chain amino acid ABC transporter permease [Caldinitratiruptor microaerophilus]